MTEKPDNKIFFNPHTHEAFLTIANSNTITKPIILPNWIVSVLSGLGYSYKRDISVQIVSWACGEVVIQREWRTN
jgi:hypothetical protein